MLDIIREEFIKWTDKQFPEGTALGAANHLIEEADELSTELTHDHHDNTISEESKIELADAQMLVWYIQDKLNISDEEMGLNILKKLVTNKTRKWKKNPNGSYSHVK